MILLREATDADLELTLAWRSNPLVYRGLYIQSREARALSWEEHYTWWHKTGNWKKFIIVLYENDVMRSVGYLNINFMNGWQPEIGLAVGEVTLWNKGVGKEALRLALDWLKYKGYKYACTTILEDNDSSDRLFCSVGFKRVCPAREGEWRYEVELYISK